MGSNKSIDQYKKREEDFLEMMKNEDIKDISMGEKRSQA